MSALLKVGRDQQSSEGGPRVELDRNDAGVEIAQRRMGVDEEEEGVFRRSNK